MPIYRPYQATRYDQNGNFVYDWGQISKPDMTVLGQSVNVSRKVNGDLPNDEIAYQKWVVQQPDAEKYDDKTLRKMYADILSLAENGYVKSDLALENSIVQNTKNTKQGIYNMNNKALTDELLTIQDRKNEMPYQFTKAEIDRAWLDKFGKVEKPVEGPIEVLPIADDERVIDVAIERPWVPKTRAMLEGQIIIPDAQQIFNSIYKPKDILPPAQLTGVPPLKVNNIPHLTATYNVENINAINKKASLDLKNTMKGIRADAVADGLANNKLDMVDAANIATGLNTAANTIAGIYGVVQASKMRPELPAYQAPIEPSYIKDRSAAMVTSGKEDIDKAVNTARATQRRMGVADISLLGKETEALNRLSGQVGQYLSGVDAANVQIENQVKQYNDQTARQAGQFNSQAINNFNAYKTGIVSQGMSGISQNITSGIQSIFNNKMVGKAMETGELETLYNRLDAAIASNDFTAVNQLKKQIDILKNNKKS